MTRSGHKIIFTEDESIVITDKSGNEIHLDTAGSNINITAPETMTLNCKNMNINVGENMSTTVGQDQSTSVGANQSTSVGQNISESVGMNKTSSIGMLNMLSVGTDFITNVTGKMVEFITGNKESHTEKDRTQITNGKVSSESKGMHEFHSEKEVQNNSGEKSKNY